VAGQPSAATRAAESNSLHAGPDPPGRP